MRRQEARIRRIEETAAKKTKLPPITQTFFHYLGAETREEVDARIAEWRESLPAAGFDQHLSLAVVLEVEFVDPPTLAEDESPATVGGANDSKEEPNTEFAFTPDAASFHEDVPAGNNTPDSAN